MTAMARPSSQDDVRLQQKRRAAFAAETTGLLLIACMLLALVLLGFWRDLHWSLR